MSEITLATLLGRWMLNAFKVVIKVYTWYLLRLVKYRLTWLLLFVNNYVFGLTLGLAISLMDSISNSLLKLLFMPIWYIFVRTRSIIPHNLKPFILIFYLTFMQLVMFLRFLLILVCSLLGLWCKFFLLISHSNIWRLIQNSLNPLLSRASNLFVAYLLVPLPWLPRYCCW